MTQTADSGIDELRTTIAGLVVGPRDAAYDDARRVWNAAIDRRPALIAQCVSVADVRTAVLFGVHNGLEISIRGGAHSMSGAAVVDDGLMIDVSALNKITVDPEAKRAVVGGGALLSELDAATAEYGLAAPAGMISHTGVAGLTLGGGMGYLTRKFGLSLDNVLSVQIVTADGRVLRAAADENPELYWAVRGGGGNFGVVTEFEFQLHEMAPIVQYGLLWWDLEHGADVLRLARDLVPNLPREVTVIIGALNAPHAPFVPAEHQLKPGYALVVVGFEAEQFEETVDQVRTALPPTVEFTTPMPFTEVQKSIDEPNAWGHYCYDKGIYIEDLTDEAIEVITDQVARKVSPLSNTLFYRLDGAYSEIDDDETAFGGGRSPRYAVFLVAISSTAEGLPPERDWVRTFWEELQPHALGTGSYVNAMAEFDTDRVRASYGEKKYARLQGIKTVYDPDNVFHRNMNIEPL
ncbi:FAD-binding oxidoreductase [Kribbella albertanoniae]|uniref:FAD-binding oxidoreductase n=1 Tax=Kribbella albertanoniae TaxID=1266829 RepID=A0A4R4QC28_9ACTN|nr:FAD-binding oxidoreductase [Kribbella albertanoniae]TDC32947.1 FAD-binding oxidoreductase [Kribbella albertanoniae]